MRLLFVVGSYPPMKCGVADYSEKLINALIKEDDEIEIFVLTGIEAKLERADIPRLTVLPIVKKWGLTSIFYLIKIINELNVDVVHLQYPSLGYKHGLLPWILPLYFSIKKKVRIVQTWHEFYTFKHIPMFMIRALAKSKLIFVRPNYVNHLNFFYRILIAESPSYFIPNASSIPKSVLNEAGRSKLKKKYLKNQKRLIVFFGFIYPPKGVEKIFEIANSSTDQLVIAGGGDENSNYYSLILGSSLKNGWKEKVTITGFLDVNDVADLLAVSDAVILPFREGGGVWNTSIHGAVNNNAFVITTSKTKRGFDEMEGVYYAPVDDVAEMKYALDNRKIYKYSSRKIRDDWSFIAQHHIQIYK